MSFEDYKEKIGSIEEKIASSGKERGALFDNFKARLNELLQLRVGLEQAALISTNVDVNDSAKELQARLDDESSTTSLEPIPPARLADAKRFVALANDDLFSYAGVLWYRGTARCHRLLEAPVLADALSRWQVSRVVMGHTPTPDHRIRQRFDGRAIMADTGMLTEYYGGQPAGLIPHRGGSKA